MCIEQGAHAEQLAVCGLDAAGIEQAVRAEMAALSAARRDGVGAA